MWYLKPMHPHVIIDLNANYSYLIAHCLVVWCLVIDSMYSACASIHACKRSNRHVVGLEAFILAISNAILSPLCKKTPLSP
jgi:hypothetical protein